MMGETAGISNLCEYEWFEWVMYYNPGETYPEDKIIIGCCRGPTADVGSAMTYTIIYPIGNYVCCSTVGPRMAVKNAPPTLIAKRKAFMTKTLSNTGPGCTTTNFDDPDLISEFKGYTDNHNEDGFEGTPDEVLPPTPEVSDNYIIACLKLPHDNSLSQGKVLQHARSPDGGSLWQNACTVYL